MDIYLPDIIEQVKRCQGTHAARLRLQQLLPNLGPLPTWFETHQPLTPEPPVTVIYTDLEPDDIFAIACIRSGTSFPICIFSVDKSLRGKDDGDIYAKKLVLATTAFGSAFLNNLFILDGTSMDHETTTSILNQIRERSLNPNSPPEWYIMAPGRGRLEALLSQSREYYNQGTVRIYSGTFNTRAPNTTAKDLDAIANTSELILDSSNFIFSSNNIDSLLHVWPSFEADIAKVNNAFINAWRIFQEDFDGQLVSPPWTTPTEIWSDHLKRWCLISKLYRGNCAAEVLVEFELRSSICVISTPCGNPTVIEPEPFVTDKGQIKKTFGSYGDICKIERLSSTENMPIVGEAFNGITLITFKTEESAKAALSLNGNTRAGHTLTVYLPSYRKLLPLSSELLRNDTAYQRLFAEPLTPDERRHYDNKVASLYTKNVHEYGRALYNSSYFNKLAKFKKSTVLALAKNILDGPVCDVIIPLGEALQKCDTLPAHGEATSANIIEEVNGYWLCESKQGHTEIIAHDEVEERQKHDQNNGKSNRALPRAKRLAISKSGFGEARRLFERILRDRVLQALTVIDQSASN